MNDVILENSDEKEFSYKEIILILLRNKTLFLSILFATIGISVFTSFRKPLIYQSSMQMLIESNNPLSELSQNNVGEQSRIINPFPDMATQLNIMRSRYFAERLKNSLIAEYPDITVDEIRKSLNIKNVIENKEKTKIIEVTYSSNSPNKTKKALISLEQIYQNYINKQENSRLSQGLKQVDEQLRTAQLSLANNQKKINEFRNRYGTVEPKQQALVQESLINDLDKELKNIQIQISELDKKYSVLKNQTDSPALSILSDYKLTSSKRYQTQLDKIKSIDIELARSSVTLTNNNPIIRNMQKERQEQIILLRNEVVQVVGSSGRNTYSDQALLAIGQLSPLDLANVNEINRIQVDLQGLKGRKSKIIETKTNAIKNLKTYPYLISEYDKLGPETEQDQSLVKKLLEQRQEIRQELIRGGYTWQMVDNPQLGIKTGPSHIKDTLIGLTVGLFLALGAVFITESVYKKPKNLDGTSEKSDIDILGTLPVILPNKIKLKNNNSYYRKLFGYSKILGLLSNPMFCEAIDLIYTSIFKKSSNSDLRSLVITSFIPQQGKTLFAFGLAVKLSKSELRVLIIDLEPNYYQLQISVEKENQQNLSGDLTSRFLISMIKTVDIEGHCVDVLSSKLSSVSLNIIDLIGTEIVENTLNELNNTYDFILFDAPSLFDHNILDKIILLRSNLIFVNQSESPFAKQYIQYHKPLEMSNIVGVVNNRYLSNSS